MTWQQRQAQLLKEYLKMKPGRAPVICTDDSVEVKNAAYKHPEVYNWPNTRADYEIFCKAINKGDK